MKNFKFIAILLVILTIPIVIGMVYYWTTSTQPLPIENTDNVIPEPIPIIEVANEETSVKLKVLVLEYYPDMDSNGIIDEVAGGDVRGQTVEALKNKVSNLNTQTVEHLTAGTRYKGYRENSQPYINYEIVDKKIFDKPVPVSNEFKPFADHFQILKTDVDICAYVEQQNIKEVWIWMYHSDTVVPIESNMASNHGDISNSYRQNDLPICNKTYTVYNYNYGRGLGEAIEDHTHQLEALFNWVDGRDSAPVEQWPELLFWGKFVGSDTSHKIINPGCGWTHYPPNGIKDYDWMNINNVASDCLDWNPQRTGQKTSISCATWGCNNDAGTKFKVWWMQNLPGYGNTLNYQGKQLRNWWEFKADFDTALSRGKSLVSNELSVSPTPTITPLVTPTATPEPTISATPTEIVSPTPSPEPSATPIITVNIDFDANNKIDISDFVLFAQYYKASDCKADLDKDNLCRDIDDFSIFVEKYKTER